MLTFKISHFNTKMLFVRCLPSYMCLSENEREHGIDNEKMWQSYLKKKVLKKKNTKLRIYYWTCFCLTRLINNDWILIDWQFITTWVERHTYRLIVNRCIPLWEILLDIGLLIYTSDHLYAHNVCTSHIASWGKWCNEIYILNKLADLVMYYDWLCNIKSYFSYLNSMLLLYYHTQIQFNQNAWCYYIFISVKNNDQKCYMYFLGFVFFVLIWSSFLAHSTDLVAKWKAWKQLIYSILRKHNVPLQNKMICIKLKYKAKECWCNTSYSIDLYPAIT